MSLILPLAVLAGYLVFVWFLWRETYGLPLSSRSSVLSPKPRPHTLDVQERVLFVCTHNSARSQMAEALLRDAAGVRFAVASAGTAPTRIHPLAVQVMGERGISLASSYAKSLAEVGTAWDYVITVCDAAFEQCPDYPAKTCRLHWGVEDPSRETGSPVQDLAIFRRVRDELSGRINQWLIDRPEAR